MWLVKQHPIARTVCKGSWAKNAVVELLYKRRKWWNFSYTLRHVYAWQFWGCEWTRMILASNKCVTGWCSMMFHDVPNFDFSPISVVFWFCNILHIFCISGHIRIRSLAMSLDVLRLFGKVPRLFPVERPGFWCCVLSDDMRLWSYRIISDPTTGSSCCFWPGLTRPATSTQLLPTRQIGASPSHVFCLTLASIFRHISRPRIF